MSASRSETILARVSAALANATPARRAVYRYRGESFAPAELPAIVVRRVATTIDAASFDNDQVTTQFDLECLVAAGEGTETAADALHVAAHTVLQADAVLASLGKATLRCTGTDSDTDVADVEMTRLVAHYTIDAWVLQVDLSTPV